MGAGARRCDGGLGRVSTARTVVIAREGGRSSIPEGSMSYGEAAAYWIPRLRGE